MRMRFAEGMPFVAILLRRSSAYTFPVLSTWALNVLPCITVTQACHLGPCYSLWLAHRLDDGHFTSAVCRHLKHNLHGCATHEYAKRLAASCYPFGMAVGTVANPFTSASWYSPPAQQQPCLTTSSFKSHHTSSRNLLCCPLIPSQHTWTPTVTSGGCWKQMRDGDAGYRQCKYSCGNTI